MGPTRDNPVLENLGPPPDRPCFAKYGTPMMVNFGNPPVKGCLQTYASPGFFLAVSKKLKPEKTQGFQKKLKQISQKIKDPPTLKTEYHLIFGQFFRNSARSTFLGFF